MIYYDPTLQSHTTAINIKTSCNLLGKRYFIRETDGMVVRAGTFTGYSNEFFISTCGLKNGSYNLIVEDESISFKIDKT